MSGPDVRYSAGDTVVHPRHGVATVRGTTTRPSSDGSTDYVELFVTAKGMTIMVPVESLDEVGIRSLPTRAEAEAILEIVGEPSDVPTAWQERNAATKLRMDSTELVQASMIIRDLARHASRSGKPLSTAENATLDACLDTVSMQLSLALDVSQDDARALIMEKVGAHAAS